MADTIKEVLDKLAEDVEISKSGEYAKLQANSLVEIKRIIEESMPITFSSAAMTDSETNHYGAGYNHALEKYHNNLLKALGE